MWGRKICPFVGETLRVYRDRLWREHDIVRFEELLSKQARRFFPGTRWCVCISNLISRGIVLTPSIMA